MSVHVYWRYQNTWVIKKILPASKADKETVFMHAIHKELKNYEITIGVFSPDNIQYEKSKIMVFEFSKNLDFDFH